MTSVSEPQPTQPALDETTAGPVDTGPAAAVVLATGLGALALGLATTLAEASTWVHDGLQFNDRVGPLSGKTIVAGIVFFVSWGVLAALWRRTSPPLRAVVAVSVVLIAAGIVGTFPIFFQAFASE